MFRLFKLFIVLLLFISCSRSLRKLPSSSLVERFGIYNGVDAGKDDLPMFTSLNDKHGVFCGGIYLDIEPGYIVTSAQCVNPEYGPFDLYVNAYCSRKEGSTCTDDASFVAYADIEIYMHPDFKLVSQSETFEYFINDLAVIKLPTKNNLKKSPNVNWLETSGLSLTQAGVKQQRQMGRNADEQKNMNLVLYGMGYVGEKELPEVLQRTKGKMEIVDQSVCGLTGEKVDGLICVRGEESDGCEGDAGSALVELKGDRIQVVGLSSSGGNCFIKPFVGLYTTIRDSEKNVTWVYNVLKGQVQPIQKAPQTDEEPTPEKEPTPEEEPTPDQDTGPVNQNAYTYQDFYICKRISTRIEDREVGATSVIECYNRFNEVFPTASEKKAACEKYAMTRKDKIDCNKYMRFY